MENRKIGLLGAGNMAGALIRGLLGSKTLRPEQIRASDPRADQLAQLETSYGIETHADNSELLAWANVVVLAVKPQVIGQVLERVSREIQRDTLVISIAAGVPLAALEARLPAGARVLRAMPNTAAIALAGATGIAPGSHRGARRIGPGRRDRALRQWPRLRDDDHRRFGRWRRESRLEPRDRPDAGLTNRVRVGQIAARNR